MLNSRKSFQLKKKTLKLKVILLIEFQTRRYNGSVLKHELCLIALRCFLLAEPDFI